MAFAFSYLLGGAPRGGTWTRVANGRPGRALGVSVTSKRDDWLKARTETPKLVMFFGVLWQNGSFGKPWTTSHLNVDDEGKHSWIVHFIVGNGEIVGSSAHLGSSGDGLTALRQAWWSDSAFRKPWWFWIDGLCWKSYELIMCVNSVDKWWSVSLSPSSSSSSLTITYLS